MVYSSITVINKKASLEPDMDTFSALSILQFDGKVMQAAYIEAVLPCTS